MTFYVEFSIWVQNWPSSSIQILIRAIFVSNRIPNFIHLRISITSFAIRIWISNPFWIFPKKIKFKTTTFVLLIIATNYENRNQFSNYFFDCSFLDLILNLSIDFYHLTSTIESISNITINIFILVYFADWELIQKKFEFQLETFFQLKDSILILRITVNLIREKNRW